MLPVTLSTEKTAQRGAQSEIAKPWLTEVIEQPTALHGHPWVLVHDAPQFHSLLATPNAARGRVTY